MKKHEFLCFYTYPSLLSLQDDIFIAWFPLKVLFEYTAISFYAQQPISLLDLTNAVLSHSSLTFCSLDMCCCIMSWQLNPAVASYHICKGRKGDTEGLLPPAYA